ncbi:MAG TPA: DUF6531 domain-containing protein, partial [Pyrinomonadaceae bacterium]|nr:DUF6531 domain-containing protein [Pyrinomonadaceae bacterium]
LGIGLRKLVNVARKAGREATERAAKRSHQNPGCGKAGEPIDIVTGANVDDFIDFAMPAPRFVWRRWYNSQHQHTQHPRPLGWGFRHAYQRELRYDATSAQFT